MRATLTERLESRLVETPGGCLEFTGWVNDRGYGKIWDGIKLSYAHRVAWSLVNGPVPAGLYVCHRCDNPPCCNPEHLFAGTQQENVADMIAKGRENNPKKTHCPQGHPYDAVNAFVVKGRSGNICRACTRERVHAYDLAHKEERHVRDTARWQATIAARKAVDSVSSAA